MLRKLALPLTLLMGATTAQAAIRLDCATCSSGAEAESAAFVKYIQNKSQSEFDVLVVNDAAKKTWWVSINREFEPEIGRTFYAPALRTEEAVASTLYAKLSSLSPEEQVILFAHHGTVVVPTDFREGGGDALVNAYLLQQQLWVNLTAKGPGTHTGARPGDTVTVVYSQDTRIRRDYRATVPGPSISWVPDSDDKSLLQQILEWIFGD